jgi:hypothetical protein
LTVAVAAPRVGLLRDAFLLASQPPAANTNTAGAAQARADQRRRALASSVERGGVVGRGLGASDGDAPGIKLLANGIKLESGSIFGRSET